ncbi:hypothetical protein BDB01DRAFT_850048 [Pilobolus umbonatus]|nr:hypothetical protein BDB01DRAFT_850048 [Pilobolus umbonatus]
MNLGRFDYLETQPFPLKSLKLLVTHITVKDAQYINRRLPQLNKLEMNPGSTTEKGNAILGTVLQAKFLDQVRFILPITLAPYDGQLIVNGCLTNLTIESSSIQISMLQKIAICYPKLNNLCFKTNNILTDDENNNDDRVHYIPMNTTSFDIKQSSYHAPKWSTMVIKAVGDIWVKSWSYCEINRKTIISDDIHTTDIKPLANTPLYVFNIYQCRRRQY